MTSVNFKRQKFFFCFLACLSFFSCEKAQVTQIGAFALQTPAPIVFTLSGSQIDRTIKTGGVVLVHRTDSIIAVGMCWSKHHNPKLSTAGDSLTSDKLSQQQFTSLITGLTPGEVYYVSAYVTTVKNLTIYGQEVAMQLSPTPLPQTGVVLIKKALSQPFNSNTSSKIVYDSVVYRSDTSGKIIDVNGDASGASFSCTDFIAPQAGLYSFTSTIAFTLSSGLNLTTLNYPIHRLQSNGQTLTAATAVVPCTSLLSTTVHLDKGDRVSTVLVNNSNGIIYSNPSTGIVRFEGYLVNSD